MEAQQTEAGVAPLTVRCCPWRASETSSAPHSHIDTAVTEAIVHVRPAAENVPATAPTK